MTGVPLELDSKYEILRPLAQGGMGSIYLVRHRHLDSIRVVKVIHDRLRGNEGLMTRFLREAKTAVKLRHPNLAQMFDFEITADGIAYIVMEYIDGLNLRQVVDQSEGPLDRQLVYTIARQVLDALAYLHRQGFVHRDVSPDNLMLTYDEEKKPVVQLIDLGIAKPIADDFENVTATGLFVGKIRYASPEQALAGRLDGRSDLYSFGVVLYELLTRESPVSGMSPQEILQQHIIGSPRPFSETDPKGRVPEPLRKVILRALEKKPEDRFQTAEAFEEALVEAQTLESADSAAEETRIVSVTDLWERMVEHDEAAPHDVAGVNVAAPYARNTPGTEADELPRQLGRFTLLDTISRGKSGLLYKAYDPSRDELVGVKVVSSENAVDQKRFLRAGKIWLHLHHPNIVRVHEVLPGGVEHGPLIVTEFIDGSPLHVFASEVPIAIDERVRIVMQICSALAAIHHAGVIHREVKPENILITRNGRKALLLDSGIARPAAGTEDPLTNTGVVVGDLSYMAPEQLRGEPEQRSDVFSLAAVLLFLLTRKPPAIGIPREAVENVKTIAGVSHQLHTVLEKALSTDPEERFESAEALAEALKETLPLERVSISRSNVVVTLHGIRTHAAWQRAFSEVAMERGWYCHQDKWNFGYFSVFRFLMPWSRHARVSWFRRTYQEEFPEVARNRWERELPSIVAHSFGTYILGNALIRYPYLRFNKVILCGSILPQSFPWDAILARGQVQAVRNEYGAQDIWTRLVDRFVPGTGASGLDGFTFSTARCEQEKFDFTHSEYFERSHMEGRWIPFLRRRLPYVESAERTIPEYAWRSPWMSYVLFAAVVMLLCLATYLAVP